MILLEDKNIKFQIFKEYTENFLFFPLIGSVLEGFQEGKVYVDSIINSSIIVVIHKFGFAQILVKETSEKVMSFIEKVICLEIELNSNKKFRFYDTNDSVINHFTSSQKFKVDIGDRNRYQWLNPKNLLKKVRNIAIQDIQLINSQLKLDVDTRFWSSESDFKKYGNAFVLKKKKEIQSICYAAAISNNCAEIDVATNENYTRKGFAKQAVLGFVSNCKNSGITPLWDCYSNNLGSVNTALSAGFEEIVKYKFLIISKKEK